MAVSIHVGGPVVGVLVIRALLFGGFISLY